MAIPSKVTKKIALDLRDMSTEEKNRLKDQVGKLIVERITDDVSLARSPVTGRGFKGLSDEYKAIKRKKGQPAVPNLQLTDRMLKALRFKRVRDGVEVGVFAQKQALKADNHCKFSSESQTTPVPRRTFIPRPEENFRPDIRKEIEQLTKEFRKDLGLKVNKDRE